MRRVSRCRRDRSWLRRRCQKPGCGDDHNLVIGHQVLDCVNSVRTVQGLETLGAIELDASGTFDAMLDAALGCDLGPATHPQLEREHRWALSFPDPGTSRAVAETLAARWSRDHSEVEAPQALVDLAVAAHYGLVFADDMGFLKGWIVPSDDDPALWRLCVMPGFCAPPGHDEPIGPATIEISR